MSDPFVIVQDDVVSSFEQAKTLLASWQRLNTKRRSPQEENEFQFMTDELHSSLKSIDTDLDDLQETIAVASDFQRTTGCHQQSWPNAKSLSQLSREPSRHAENAEPTATADDADEGSGRWARAERAFGAGS
ncbi:hypothetical protein BX661DRAFT_52257 [Kickxella alabastrina]|uniref:uncharacterized protein n=1 Tax=Kickxella alabastrina TaxID=61397 RepID=UPI00221FCA15|nr:uncharacterized protein BX661DRAFT_52257 [Kickxella alabastrina]KAI7834369.1 hypothetical protein BX661DRAFT_52257 [Kickxella alabastrina]